MKKTLLILSILALCMSASAAPIDVAALRKYAKQSLVRCPEALVAIEQVPQAGPLNFVTFYVDVNSPDENCRTRKYLLYSPSTQQVIVGTAFVLPQDARPISERVAEHAAKLIQVPATATVAGFPLPDGLKAVSITRQTSVGPFSYHGYVDGSERFLIIGTRGNLRTPPGTTLREALGTGEAVRRGNRMSKVEVIELSDFECPTCAKAHEVVMPFVEKNLSKINFGRLDLPLFEHHEWALAAALGARAISRVAPKQYWTYCDFLFKNQEPIGKQKFDKVLQNFCEDHDIAWTHVAPIYRSAAEKQALLDQVSRAFDNNVNATPTFLVNGQPTDFGPNGEYILKAIREAIGSK